MTFWFCRFLAAIFLLTLMACGEQTAVVPSSILYLARDEADVSQLHRIDINGADPLQLTESADDILNFALSPDGESVAYATLNDAGGAIWLMDADGRSLRQLLTCPDAECGQMVWHPDGRRLAYERVEFATPSLPRLWWLDTTTGETKTALQDAERISRSAAFSPDGRWLSYVGSPDEGIGLFDLENGRQLSVYTEMGTPAVWHPESQSLLFRHRAVTTLHGSDGESDDHSSHSHDYAESIYLSRFDLADESTTILSGGIVDDGLPAWSPDGVWIALGRKAPRANTGRQIWLMRGDGNDERPLTHDPDFNFGALGWSEDGRLLLTQRYEVKNPNAQPGIWTVDVESGEMEEVVAGGFLPAWSTNGK